MWYTSAHVDALRAPGTRDDHTHGFTDGQMKSCVSWTCRLGLVSTLNRTSTTGAHRVNTTAKDLI